MGNRAVAAESIERPVCAVLRAADLRSFGEQSRGCGPASAAQHPAAPPHEGLSRDCCAWGSWGVRGGWARLVSARWGAGRAGRAYVGVWQGRRLLPALPAEAAWYRAAGMVRGTRRCW